jgi:hypothetical protein
MVIRNPETFDHFHYIACIYRIFSEQIGGNRSADATNKISHLLQEWLPEDSSASEILEEIEAVTDDLYKHDAGTVMSFVKDATQKIIESGIFDESNFNSILFDLVTIAKADREVTENEASFINKMAEYFDIEFSIATTTRKAKKVQERKETRKEAKTGQRAAVKKDEGRSLHRQESYKAADAKEGAISNTAEVGEQPAGGLSKVTILFLKIFFGFFVLLLIIFALIAITGPLPDENKTAPAVLSKQPDRKNSTQAEPKKQVVINSIEITEGKIALLTDSTLTLLNKNDTGEGIETKYILEKPIYLSVGDNIRVKYSIKAGEKVISEVEKIESSMPLEEPSVTREPVEDSTPPKIEDTAPAIKSPEQKQVIEDPFSEKKPFSSDP